MKQLLKTLLLIFIISFPAHLCTAQESLYKKLNAEMKTHFENGRHSEAIETAKKAVEVAENTFGKEHPYVAASLNNLGMMYVAKHNYEIAEPLFERSLRIMEKVRGENDPILKPMLESLIKCSAEMRNIDKELEYRDRLRDLR